MRSKLLKSLETRYLLDPTSLPTAFWKMKTWVTDDNIKIVEQEDVTSILLFDRMLLRVPIEAGYSPSVDESMSLIVLKNPCSLPQGFREEQYFKLYHDHQIINAAQLKESYDFKTVEIRDIKDIVSFINGCYDLINVSEEEVIHWTQRPVYDSNLWIWIVNKETRQRVALGIAEYDDDIKEGVLEWIQVDATFRGQKLGQALVNELLKRLDSKARFTTVSGQVNNETKPELLYRNCGFQGTAIWHIYRKDQQ